MKRPVILIFPSRKDDCTMMSVRYTDAIRCHGGVPLLIPMNTDEETLSEMIRLADGFLFSGGVDLDPALYGEEKLNGTVEVDPVRDALEMTGMRLILKTDKPILGICRGIQSVNVGMGGTLYQDIPSQRPSDICHRQTAPATEPTHNVTVEDGTLLRSLLKETVMTNSFHHQGVKDPAPGLRVAARADDGMIEALEGTTDRFILLVRWHPEFTHSTDPSSDALFSAFIKAARGDR